MGRDRTGEGTNLKAIKFYLSSVSHISTLNCLHVRFDFTSETGFEFDFTAPPEQSESPSRTACHPPVSLCEPGPWKHLLIGAGPSAAKYIAITIKKLELIVLKDFFWEGGGGTIDLRDMENIYGSRHKGLRVCDILLHLLRLGL